MVFWSVYMILYRPLLDVEALTQNNQANNNLKIVTNLSDKKYLLDNKQLDLYHTRTTCDPLIKTLFENIVGKGETE